MIIAFKTNNEDEIFKQYLNKLEKKLSKIPESQFEMATQPFMNYKIITPKKNIYVMKLESIYILLGIIMYILEKTIFPTIIYWKIKQELKKRRSQTTINRISKTELIEIMMNKW
jgi:hypothetical protein